MKGRCYNPKEKSYKWYGNRGIAVCNEWLDSRDSFISWGIDTGYEPGLEIDRTNNDGNYEPDNCKWVTRIQNQRNKRDTILLTVNGDTKCASEWSVILGFEKCTIAHHFKLFGKERTENYIRDKLNGCYSNKRTKYLTANGITLSYSEWCKQLEMTDRVVYQWIRRKGEGYAIGRIEQYLDQRNMLKNENTKTYIYGYDCNSSKDQCSKS